MDNLTRTLANGTLDEKTRAAESMAIRSISEKNGGRIEILLTLDPQVAKVTCRSLAEYVKNCDSLLDMERMNEVAGRNRGSITKGLEAALSRKLKGLADAEEARRRAVIVRYFTHTRLKLAGAADRLAKRTAAKVVPIGQAVKIRA